MTQEFDPTRRSLSVSAALALLGFPLITISACGGGGSPSAPNPPTTTVPPAPGDEVGNVAANHGHTASITAAQLQAGSGLSLDIRGSATHPHRIDVSGADVVAIRGGQRVSVNSTTEDGHNHSVTFN